MSKEAIPEAKRVGASRRGGNVFRPSQAPSHLRIANNLPGRYPVESWRAEQRVMPLLGWRWPAGPSAFDLHLVAAPVQTG